GEGSGIPTEPHRTPSPEAPPQSPTTYSSPTLPYVTTTSIPDVTPFKTTPIWQYTRRARISQSSALLNVVDEPDSPLRDVSQGEACPTNSGFIADQDKATIVKSSTLPHDSAPRVTSPTAVEGSMQQIIPELTVLYTSLQRQLSELTAKFQAQEVEINRLKERVKLLEDREGVAAIRSGDDAAIKERSMDEEETATERIIDDSEEMATVLTSMDATTVLASGVVDVPTSSGSIPTTGTLAEEQVPTGSDVVPTTSPVFGTATVVTPYRRRKGKEVMVESKTPKKQKVQEQIDAQMEEFIPMGSKKEAERIKGKGLNLEQESTKNQKTLEEVPKEVKYPEKVPKEKVKEMMQLVPIEEVYVEALQVIHPIIDWKDKEIFMLVEKDYPLRKGLALVMITYKLQVKNYSQMANDLILKIYKIANSPRQQVIEFPLAEQLPTTSEEGCHCQKKSEATARKIALLSKVKKKLKLLKFSKLAMRDLSEDIMVPISQQRRVREKYLREMRCLRIVSKFMRYSIFRVEAKALPTNDARVIVKFLKSLFS
nr:hypothetical protein [Tanacetum cinerariifolium]